MREGTGAREPKTRRRNEGRAVLGEKRKNDLRRPLSGRRVGHTFALAKSGFGLAVAVA